MNINTQLNNVRMILFDEKIKNNSAEFRQQIIDHLNNIIYQYQIEKQKVWTDKQKALAKKLLLEEQVIPLVQDPTLKGIVWSLHSEYEKINSP